MADLAAAAPTADHSSADGVSTSTAGSGWTISTWPAALIVGVCSTAIAWMRMPAGVAGQLYAEDGLVFFFSRDVTSFWPSRVALGPLTAVAPIVAFEALGNLANLHWFLLYMSIWVLLATPRSVVGAWGMGVVALLCTATEPQCAMVLPLAVWAVVRSRRSRPVVLCWTVGVVAQVVTTLIAPREIARSLPISAVHRRGLHPQRRNDPRLDQSRHPAAGPAEDLVVDGVDRCVAHPCRRGSRRSSWRTR